MSAIVFTGLVGQASNTKRDGFYLDCDYTNAEPCGVPVPEYPFASQGDNETVILTQPHEQALRNYKAPSLTEKVKGKGDIYCLGDTNFKDIGCGVVSFDRRFANIPKQRKVNTSFPYPFQLAYLDLSLNRVLETRTSSVASTLIYDYFVVGDEDSFQLLQAPKLDLIGGRYNKRGVDYNEGAFPLSVTGAVVICSTDTMLAEDDCYEEWEGAIHCRKRRIIAGPTADFWGSVYGG